MKRRGSSGKKERDYKVLFLILEKEKKVHREISFSKEPAAVLRKHWRGEVDETKDLFSRNNPRQSLLCGYGILTGCRERKQWHT